MKLKSNYILESIIRWKTDTFSNIKFKAAPWNPNFKKSLPMQDKIQKLIAQLDKLLNIIQKMKQEMHHLSMTESKNIFPYQWAETATNAIMKNQLSLKTAWHQNDKNSINHFLSMISYDMQHIDDIDLKWSTFKLDLSMLISDIYNQVEHFQE
jgi:hypothetical protein